MICHEDLSINESLNEKPIQFQDLDRLIFQMGLVTVPQPTPRELWRALKWARDEIALAHEHLDHIRAVVEES